MRATWRPLQGACRKHTCSAEPTDKVQLSSRHSCRLRTSFEYSCNAPSWPTVRTVHGLAAWRARARKLRFGAETPEGSPSVVSCSSSGASPSGPTSGMDKWRLCEWVLFASRCYASLSAISHRIAASGMYSDSTRTGRVCVASQLHLAAGRTTKTMCRIEEGQPPCPRSQPDILATKRVSRASQTPAPPGRLLPNSASACGFATSCDWASPSPLPKAHVDAAQAVGRSLRGTLSGTMVCMCVHLRPVDKVCASKGATHRTPHRVAKEGWRQSGNRQHLQLR